MLDSLGSKKEINLGEGRRLPILLTTFVLLMSRMTIDNAYGMGYACLKEAQLKSYGLRQKCKRIVKFKCVK